MNDIDTLVKQLHHPVTTKNMAALEAAAMALGRQGEQALPAIQGLFTSAEVDVRFWAVRALWANGGQAAITLLIETLSDEDEMVRSGAALALGELKAEAAIPALTRLMTSGADSAGDHAADALSKMGLPAAPVLITALGESQAQVRIRAAKALVPVESQAAIKALIDCLDNDPGYLVRHYADIALKRMGVGEMVYFR
jgi:HEAT repeat protein